MRRTVHGHDCIDPKLHGLEKFFVRLITISAWIQLSPKIAAASGLLQKCKCSVWSVVLSQYAVVEKRLGSTGLSGKLWFLEVYTIQIFRAWCWRNLKLTITIAITVSALGRRSLRSTEQNMLIVPLIRTETKQNRHFCKNASFFAPLVIYGKHICSSLFWNYLQTGSRIKTFCIDLKILEQIIQCTPTFFVKTRHFGTIDGYINTTCSSLFWIHAYHLR